MKRLLDFFVIALFLSAASLAIAKDYQVTGRWSTLKTM